MVSEPVPAHARPVRTRRMVVAWCAAIAATLSLAVCTFLTTSVALGRWSECIDRQLRVARLCADVRYLDEVLTMAANMAAATGEARWRTRYDAHVGELDATIAALRAVSPSLFDRELGADTDAANRRLVAMESDVFAAVAAGERARARAVLDGAAYAADKVVYAQGNERVQQALAELVARERDDAKGLSTICLLSTLALTGVAAAAWVLLVRWSREARTAAAIALERARSSAAEEASHAKSRFVAHVSHELRTPMTAILGYAELLTDPTYPASQREAACATIVRNGQHLLHVVNDLLDMSKIDAGAVELAVAATDPSGTVDDVVATMQARAHAKGLELRRTFASPLPAFVETDALRLRQILVNLVGNAIKFTERGGVHVVARHDAGASRLTIVVEDTGVGMSPAQLARLFHAFVQVDGDATRRAAGTGLGLTISQRYARLLGGDLVARSRPGTGSVFTLTLPARVVGPPLAAVAPAAAPAGTASSGALRGVRILLAEDGLDTQRLIGWLLTREGAEVVVAGNGVQALERHAAAPFDLILMDMQMPELDGYDATRRLRARGCTAPIVALTANTMAADRDRCLAAGCSEYVSKPIDRRALIATCTRLAAARPARVTAAAD